MMPVRGSLDKLLAGKTYCHAHSRAALGYLWANARGKLDIAEAVGQIAPVEFGDLDQMLAQRAGETARKHGHSVFRALAVADMNHPAPAVDVGDEHVMSHLLAPFAPVDRLLIVDVVVDIETPRILPCRQNTQIRLKIVGVPGERRIGYLGYQGCR